MVHKKNMNKHFNAFTTAAKIAPNDEHIRKNLELLKHTNASSGRNHNPFSDYSDSHKSCCRNDSSQTQQGEALEEVARDYSIHPSHEVVSPILETHS